MFFEETIHRAGDPAVLIWVVDIIWLIFALTIIWVMNFIKEHPDEIKDYAARAFRAIGRLFK